MPIFVVGAPRSGTTLVAKILGRHPDVLAPGETHYFEDVWARRKELGGLERADELSVAAERLLTSFGRFNQPGQEMVDAVVAKGALVERALALGGGYGALYYAFMNILVDSMGSLHFCDDTPRHLFYLHTVFDLFPQARVIGCVRDPRDFLCSYKNFWKAASESARMKALYHPVITSLLWRSSSNLLLKHTSQCFSDQMIWVRYETLVEHPQGEVSRICDFLRIDYSDKMIHVETHNSSFEQSSSGIFTTSVGRWRTCLGAEEIWWAQTLAKDNMSAFDYETRPVSPSKRALFRTCMTAPLALTRALQVNAHRQGPLVGYVWRRLTTLLGR